MQAHPPPRTSAAARCVSLLLRGGVLAALWWVLAEGRMRDPLFGAVAVVLALASSCLLCPVGAWRWKPVALARFLPYFLWNSLLGGVDVALRAFRPSMPLHPEIVEFPLRAEGRPALLMAWIVSLLPGTATVGFERDRLIVHVLDAGLPWERRLRELESRLAGLCEGPEEPEEPEELRGGDRDR